MSTAGGRARSWSVRLLGDRSVILAFLGQAQDQLGWDHVLRAWVLGMLLTFGWTVGGLALLMVQYCSGGKWGLLAAPSARSHEPARCR